MEFRIFTEPQQGATYEQLRRLAVASEDAGFDAFFRSDHYLAMGKSTGLPGPTDAWITLAGLARDTTRIRLGTLVTSATFRLPGPLAITVAEVDAMSGGRVELGLGAGWYEAEHLAYGIPFPALGERFARLEEQLEIITGLWTSADGVPFTFEGHHYQLTNSPALPKPVQRPRPPIIVGGGGAKRTPRLAARFADEFNAPCHQPADAAAAYARVDGACAAIGRDPTTVVHSVAVTVVCATTAVQVSARVEAAGWSEESLRTSGACGSPDEVATRLRAWIDAGATRVYLQVLDVDDLDHLNDLTEACRLATL
jgi:F420-dependent oxidoreductase-like protein